MQQRPFGSNGWDMRWNYNEEFTIDTHYIFKEVFTKKYTIIGMAWFKHMSEGTDILNVSFKSLKVLLTLSMMTHKISFHLIKTFLYLEGDLVLLSSPDLQACVIPSQFPEPLPVHSKQSARHHRWPGRHRKQHFQTAWWPFAFTLYIYIIYNTLYAIQTSHQL